MSFFAGGGDVQKPKKHLGHKMNSREAISRPSCTHYCIDIKMQLTIIFWVNPLRTRYFLKHDWKNHSCTLISNIRVNRGRARGGCPPEHACRNLLTVDKCRGGACQIFAAQVVFHKVTSPASLHCFDNSTRPGGEKNRNKNLVLIFQVIPQKYLLYNNYMLDAMTIAEVSRQLG